jgi:hypothetical protein
MALNNADKQLIDTVSESLRLRFQHEARWDGVSQEEINGNQYNIASNNASRPVEITKEELRENSGRKVARDAYLNEVASAFNQKMGVVARVDLDKGAVYAQAVPDGRDETAPMNLKQLNVDAQRAKARFAEDAEE